MMKKAILFTVVGLLVLAFALSMVSAATNPVEIPPCAYQQANLTDAQKQEMLPLWNQMADLHSQMFEVRKQMIQKQVSFGNMTQEEANQRIAWMQERKGKGFGPGMMEGRGPGMMRGRSMCQQQ